VRLPGVGFVAHLFGEKIGRNGCKAPASKPHNTGLRTLVFRTYVGPCSVIDTRSDLRTVRGLVFTTLAAAVAPLQSLPGRVSR
jgi:hypothetical protein